MVDNHNIEMEQQKEFIIISFSEKQLFNLRDIGDTKIVSVAFPASSNYKGYHMDVKAHQLKRDRFRKNMKFVYVHQKGKRLIQKTKNSNVEPDTEYLPNIEVKKEFDSWRKAKELV